MNLKDMAVIGTGFIIALAVIVSLSLPLINTDPTTFSTSPDGLDTIGAYPTTNTYELDISDHVLSASYVTVTTAPVNISSGQSVTSIRPNLSGTHDGISVEISDGHGGFTSVDRTTELNGTVTGPVQIRVKIVNLSGTYSGVTYETVDWFKDPDAINSKKGAIMGMALDGALFLITFLVSFLVINRWAGRKNTSKTGASVLSMVLVLALTGMGAAAPAVTAEYPTDLADAGQVQHTFTGLSSSSTYDVVAVTASGNTTLSTFTTNGDGAAQSTFTVAPHQQNVLVDKDGFRYFVRDNQGNKVLDVPAYYGPQLGALDVFSDGQVSDRYVLLEGGGLTETGGSPYGQLTVQSGLNNPSICLNMSVNADAGEVIDTELELTNTADLVVESHGSRQDCLNGDTVNDGGSTLTINNANTGMARFTLTPDTDAGTFTAEYDGDTQQANLETSSDGSTYYEIAVVSDTWRLANFTAHPPDSLTDWYGSTSLKGPSPHIFEGLGVYDWTGFQSVVTDGVAGFNWNTFEGESGGFKTFISDVRRSPHIEVVNTDSGRVEFLGINNDKVELFGNLAPADETSATNTFQVFEFIPTENVADLYGSFTRVGIEYSTDDGNTWDNLDGQFSSGCLEDDYTDSVGDGAFMDLSNCIQDQEPVRFQGDISQFDGSFQWRFFLNQTLQTTPTAYSEPRQFIRAVSPSSVTALYPREGTLVEDATPKFTASYVTNEPGKLNVQVDGLVRKTWRFEQADQGLKSYTPSTAIPDGQHTYRFTFTGDSGQQFQSDQVTFTVGDTPDVNVSLTNPPDNLLTTNRSVDLSFNVNRTYNVNATVLLNNEDVGSFNLDPGSSTETVTVSDLDVNTYSWSVEIQNSTTTVLSDSRQFTVTEDVNLSSYLPRDGATFSSGPVVFTANVSSSASAQIILDVDETAIEAAPVSAGFTGTKEFTLNSDEIGGPGKHAYRFRLVSDASGNEFVTSTRTFTLLESDGVDKEGPPGGVILDMFHGILEPALGTSRGTSAIIAASLIVALVGGLVSLVNPLLGMSAGAVLLFGFTAAGWIPTLFIVALVVVAAGLLVKWGRDVFTG